MSSVPGFADRLPYSAIVDRPVLRLPEGARLAVWVIVNVEHWAADGAMPRQVIPPPMGRSQLPDLPNWAWHEYGMRVGFWRILEALESRGVRATLAINGRVCETYPRIARAAHEAGWEFIGHGFVQAPMHAVGDQRQAIRDTLDAVASVTGVRPRGWESPGMTECADTLDHLSAEGVEYVADWVLDDQPIELAARPKPVVSIPYTVEANDVVMFAVQNHAADELASRSLAQFTRLHAEGARSARVMALSVHPYLTGAPHRIGWLEHVLDEMLAQPDVRFWTGGEILDWHRASARNAT